MPPSPGGPPAPRFSIVIVARNVAWALPRLLYGLRSFVKQGGEVLLMDTGSSDDTATIAQRQGCRVELAGERFETTLTAAEAAEIESRFAKQGEGPLVASGQRLFHFGAARQHAGLLAANDFVFQLDAGDQLPAMDVDALDAWIGAGDVGAFEYDQLYGNVGLRISRFYERSGYRWEGRVHEILSTAELPAAGQTAKSAKIRCERT